MLRGVFAGGVTWGPALGSAVTKQILPLPQRVSQGISESICLLNGFFHPGLPT